MWKQRCIWFVLWALSLTAISFYGGVVSYSFFYFMTLLPVTSLIYLIYVYIRFRIYQKIMTRNITVGEMIPYHFILQNEDFVAYSSVGVRLYEDFSSVEQLAGCRECQLFPGEKLQFDTSLTCKYRGEYKVGIHKIILIDFLRLFRMEYTMPSAIGALVKPKIVKLQQLRSMPDPMVVLEQDSLYEQNEMDVVTRDYMAGDSLKMIHWKVSAREQTLRSRMYTGSRKNQVEVLLDLQQLEADKKMQLATENKVLETVIALLYYFCYHNIETAVHYQAMPMQQVRRHVTNSMQFEAAYEELAQVSFTEKKKFLYLLETAQRAVASRNIWIVSQIDDTLFARAMEMTESDKLLILFCITDENMERYRKQMNPRLHVIPIGTEQDLEAVL